MTGAGEQQDARSLAGWRVGGGGDVQDTSPGMVELKAEEGKCGKVLAQPKRQVT